MSPTLLSIPIELQLSVFGVLLDLDDALYLSHTCHTLRLVYERHRRAIERKIIVPNIPKSRLVA